MIRANNERRRGCAAPAARASCKPSYVVISAGNAKTDRGMPTSSIMLLQTPRDAQAFQGSSDYRVLRTQQSCLNWMVWPSRAYLPIQSASTMT